MKQLLLISIFLLITRYTGCNKTRHLFYRDLDGTFDDARRVFGGEDADLNTFPAVAALLDRFWITRCSGSVITPYWALTAAHCVTARLAYVKYNTKRPSSKDGDTAVILYLYRHPDFKVVQEDEGRGMDVTLLHHDLGLIRTRDRIKLNAPLSPLSEMGRYSLLDLQSKDFTILGFGRTEKPTRSAGQELFAVKLRMVACDRGSWFHCLCGKATRSNTQSGVCSGDSGGPVIYQSVQVGVTSMGPAECAFLRSIPEGVTSVFTSTYNYVELINNTITEAEKAILASGGIIETDSLSVRDGSSQLNLHKESPIIIHKYSAAVVVLKVHIPIFVFCTFAMIL